MARNGTESFDPARLAELGPGGLMQALAPRVQVPEHPDTTEAQRDALTEGLDIVDRAEVMHGRHEDLGIIKSMMLGKLGEVDAAVDNARDYHRRSPTWRTAVALANALRRAKDADGAVAAFRDAAAIDPTDVTALLDIGDLLLEGERWSEAESAYMDALAREADHAWAAPSACYARYRWTGDGAALEQLRTMAGGELDECGVGGLLAQMTGGYSDDDRVERARELLAQIEPLAEAKPAKAKAKAKVAAKPKAKVAAAKAKAKVAAKAKPKAKAKVATKPKAKAKAKAAAKPKAKAAAKPKAKAAAKPKAKAKAKPAAKPAAKAKPKPTSAARRR